MTIRTLRREYVHLEQGGGIVEEVLVPSAFERLCSALRDQESLIERLDRDLVLVAVERGQRFRAVHVGRLAMPANLSVDAEGVAFPDRQGTLQDEMKFLRGWTDATEG